MSEKRNYAVAMEEVLKELGVRFESEMCEEQGFFFFSINGKYVPSLKIMIRVDKTSGITKFESVLAKEISNAKLPQIFEKLNTLTDTYRYVRYTVDSDRDILISYEFILMGEEKNACATAMLLLRSFMNIADKSTPDILKILWEKED